MSQRAASYSDRDSAAISRRWQESVLPRVRACERVHRKNSLIHRPEIGRGYPLNLSISLSGGKETNQDSLSNGE